MFLLCFKKFIKWLAQCNKIVYWVLIWSIFLSILVGGWGSRERKILAGYFFFLYTLLGSVMMCENVLHVDIRGLFCTSARELSVIYLLELKAITHWLCRLKHVEEILIRCSIEIYFSGSLSYSYNILCK
jgi:NADH:ubiquinone oxidoreductase subunit 4 (subunit M)